MVATKVKLTCRTSSYLRSYNLELEIEDRASSDFVKLRLVNSKGEVQGRKIIAKEKYNPCSDASDLILTHAAEYGRAYEIGVGLRD